MPGEKITSNKVFLTVQDGRLTQRVDENTKDAKQVTYTTKAGEKKTVYELYFKAWSGQVKDIRIKENDYNGKKWQTCDIVFPDAIVSLNTAQSFFTDFAKRIKGVDIKKPISISPYSMEVDGKNRRGMVVYQDGLKFTNAYWDGTKTLHGIPQPPKPKDQMKKADWIYYFAQEADFLVAEVLKLNEQIDHSWSDPVQQDIQTKNDKFDELMAEAQEEIDVDKIPF